MNETKPYCLNQRYSWKKLAAGCIILDVEQGSYLTMNETASAIWDGIVSGKAEADIAGALAGDYAISLNQAQADVRETLGTLVQEGVLEVCKPPGVNPKHEGKEY